MKKAFGIELLDEYLGGGLDKNTLTVIAGTLGAGKTLLASHWIAEGAKNGETCVYISSRMSITTIENYLGRMKYMEDVFDKIHWRIVDVDARQLMPVTREKLEEWNAKIVGLDLEEVDRIVFDVVTCINRALGDPVLYRRVVKTLETIYYENSITALFVEEADSVKDAAVTIGAANCAMFLDYIHTQIGEMRAIRIIKKYGHSHPIHWIPYEVSDDGISIKEGMCLAKDYDYVFLGSEYGGSRKKN